MKKRVNLLICTVAIAVLSAVIISCSPEKKPEGITRTELQRHDLSIPGREAVQLLVEFGQGVVAGNHRHPGEEVIYVTEGLLEYQVEGKPPVTLKVGEVLFIPAGTVHSAKNVGSGNGAELATYIVEKGKPLVEAVK
ncbi:MAG: cupin domain-containing protein [Ferruginibacter sp.]|nr:cupin domain-containing protein [Ferruginibacter sp.]